MRADARRNYDKLLAHAREAFERDGVDTSLEDIARSAGLGIGTLYRHFPTRDALLAAVLAGRFDRAKARADELSTSDDPAEALAEWLRGFAQGASVYRGLARAVAGVIDDPGSELHASCHAMQAAAEQLLTRAQRAGVVRTDIDGKDAFLLTGAVSSAAEQAGGDPERFERMLRVLLDGLSAR